MTEKEESTLVCLDLRYAKLLHELIVAGDGPFGMPKEFVEAVEALERVIGKACPHNSTRDGIHCEYCGMEGGGYTVEVKHGGE